MTSPDGLTDMFGQLRPHILKHADVELLAPFLQKQGTINDTQCKTLKQLASETEFGQRRHRKIAEFSPRTGPRVDCGVRGSAEEFR